MADKVDLDKLNNTQWNLPCPVVCFGICLFFGVNIRIELSMRSDLGALLRAKDV